MSLASIELNATTNRRLKSSISLYFQCEGTAQGNCNSYKEDALKYTFHEVTDTAYILVALFPLMNLIYAFQFGRWKDKFCGKGKSNVNASTQNTDLPLESLQK